MVQGMVMYDYDGPNCHGYRCRPIVSGIRSSGTTVACSGKSHYLLADIAPVVGEAITLTMRTATPWKISTRCN